MVAAQRIRVLVVDDHATVRQTLESVLAAYPNIEVVGLASDGEEAIRKATSLRPSLVIMDINLPKVDGIAATRIIKMNHPEVAVIGLSFTPQSYSEYAMLKSGAFEVVDKANADHQLYGAMQRAIASIQPVLILTNVPSGDASSEGDLPAEKLDTAPPDEQRT
jgi:DNA-binding NarL/FixJ family response regulator